MNMTDVIGPSREYGEAPKNGKIKGTGLQAPCINFRVLNRPKRMSFV